MLFKEITAVYCRNHKKHINALCRQNAEFLFVKACDMYSDHWALKDYLSCCMKKSNHCLGEPG
jgi:hypothetical protein